MDNLFWPIDTDTEKLSNFIFLPATPVIDISKFEQCPVTRKKQALINYTNFFLCMSGSKIILNKMKIQFSTRN